MNLLLSITGTILPPIGTCLFPEPSLQRFDFMWRKRVSGVITAQAGARHGVATALEATRQSSTK